MKYIALNYKKILHGYMVTYKGSISSKLKEDYVSDETKSQLKSAIKYTPCECKTETYKLMSAAASNS